MELPTQWYREFSFCTEPLLDDLSDDSDRPFFYGYAPRMLWWKLLPSQHRSHFGIKNLSDMLGSPVLFFPGQFRYFQGSALKMKLVANGRSI